MSPIDRNCREDFGSVGPSWPPREFQWYHLCLTTYGAWLPGDARGFRTTRHRLHVDGDYQHPPPKEMYAGLQRHSRDSLTRGAVSLNANYRAVVGRALIERLRGLGAFVLTLAAASQHVHCELKLPFPSRFTWIGAAKRHVWFEMRDAGWTGKLWARRKKLTPIAERTHQCNAFNYIVRHIEQGAWVWVWEGVAQSRLERVFADPGKAKSLNA